MFEFKCNFKTNYGKEKNISINEKIIEDKAIKKFIKNEELNFKRYNALTNLCEVPKPNEQWRIVTEKQFNAYALIKGIIDSGRAIDELYLAIYRINEPTVESIIQMIENGRIKKACFIISSFFNQTKKPEEWAIRLRDYCHTKENCKHIYIHNHSKVVCIKTGEDYFVFEGSGNMSDNARIEQYVYENNKEVFEFHKSWMLELAEK